MSENTLLKPIIMGATIVAIDKFVMKNENMNESLYFGLAGSIGVYTGTMVAKAMPLPLPSGEYFDGKTLELRLAEIGVGAGAGYAMNMYVFKNDYNQSAMLNKLAILASSDFIAEYFTDYLQGRKLAFFTN
jgi:uncharacterized membrane protein YgaE (UPF0421/DUF939 family)